MTRLAPRSDRGRRDRRGAAQEKLLAALERQLENGTSFAAVNVADLAADAGISRATFYIHFQDKVDLLEEWLLETRTTLFEVDRKSVV